MKALHCLEDVMPDDLILVVLSFVEAEDLVKFQATCKRYQNLDSADLWRVLCARRWQDWPMYSSDVELRRDDSSEAVEGQSASTWKDRYKWVEIDFRRTEITQEELERLEWHFNFLPWAGGRSNGTGSLSLAYFHQGRLYLTKYLWMYPILNYEVITSNTEIASMEDFHLDFRVGLDDMLGEPLRQAVIYAGTSNPRHSPVQYVQISSFPAHYIARTSNGGWVLWNENVVFFSRGLPREAQLPDQLEMHIDMFRFG
jgi:hypothetical protein